VSPSDLTALNHFRSRVFGLIGRALDVDGYHKFHEGRVSVTLPDYFEVLNNTGRYTVTLDCYVLGPTRRYEWSAHTIPDALRRAHRDLDRWEFELEGQEAAS